MPDFREDGGGNAHQNERWLEFCQMLIVYSPLPRFATGSIRQWAPVIRRGLKVVHTALRSGLQELW